jgi:CARDB protein
MKKFFLVGVFFFLILLFPIVSAEHNITGFVNNSLDSVGANGRIITLWNFSAGIGDSLTDTIGITGRSERPNAYSIDCELLAGGCLVGDILTLQIFNTGSGYATEPRNITVTGASFDTLSNITLNSPPEVNPVTPISYANLSDSLVNFNCSLNDLDGNLENVTLYGNWTGWHANETKSVVGNQDYVTFQKYLPQGVYNYSCRVFDNASIENYSISSNFTVDLTDPIISSVLINESYTCGIQQVRVTCTATDIILRIDKVIIQEFSPTGIQNYTGIFLIGDTWYSDIFIDEIGNWNFTCIVNDSAGNQENLTSLDLNGASNLPDLYINYTTIDLNNTNPIENETILISANLENLGCGVATDVNVSFFDGDPNLGGINLDNHTITLEGLASNETNITWKTQMGTHNFFLYADYWTSIVEFNETNNEGNKSFSINAWQEIFGNFSINKTLGVGQFNFSKWFNESSLSGNIFIADSESNINWLSLQAIGRTISGVGSSNDFSEIDSLLGMQNFNDSVSNRFSISQIPKQTDFFLINQKNITNVPTINSTSDKTFITGILWDYSDDIDSDNEYDSSDEEDIVFITKLNKGGIGDYGNYDYEIEVPAKLREYKTADSSQIYLYYDLN